MGKSTRRPVQRGTMSRFFPSAKAQASHAVVPDVKGKGKKVTSKSEHASPSPPPPTFDEGFLDSFQYAHRMSEMPQQRAHNDVVRQTRSSPRLLRPPSNEVHKKITSSIKPAKKRPKKELKVEEAEEILPEVPDYVKDGMDVLLIGSNPGRMSSRKKQHFGHPSNHFYRALHGGGFTPELVSPAQDYTMLEQEAPFMSLGLTNLAPRPTRLAEEVLVSENEAGAIVLSELIRRHRPRVGIFVGLGVSRAFEAATARIAARPNSAIKAEGGKVDGEGYTVSVSVPTGTPLTSDKELGLGVGLMPVALRHYNIDEASTDHFIRVKAEDEYDKTLLADRGQYQRQPPFTLLYACPSTSGRVTTHQLPQKTEVMRRARLLAEHLARVDGADVKVADDTSTEQVHLRLI